MSDILLEIILSALIFVTIGLAVLYAGSKIMDEIFGAGGDGSECVRAGQEENTHDALVFLDSQRNFAASDSSLPSGVAFF